MPYEISLISLVPMKHKRRGALLFRILFVGCLIVVAVGLLEGKSLWQSIMPVSLALAYLLIRAGAPAKEMVYDPVQARLQVEQEAVVFMLEQLDRMDGKGVRNERHQFPLAQIKALRYYEAQKALVIDGQGNVFTQWLPESGRQPAQGTETLFTIYLDQSYDATELLHYMETVTGKPVQHQTAAGNR